MGLNVLNLVLKRFIALYKKMQDGPVSEGCGLCRCIVAAWERLKCKKTLTVSLAAHEKLKEDVSILQMQFEEFKKKGCRRCQTPYYAMSPVDTSETATTESSLSGLELYIKQLREEDRKFRLSLAGAQCSEVQVHSPVAKAQSDQSTEVDIELSPEGSDN